MVIINYNEVEDLQLSEEDIQQWIEMICQRNDKTFSYLEITLCTDAFLLDMNKEYLDHDDYTDILTFDLNQNDNSKEITGELYISIDRVKDNASGLEISWLDELHRVIIHGVLHLCGWDDTNPVLKESMRKEEDVALALRMF
jgi:probable rRNA maturation factor